MNEELEELSIDNINSKDSTDEQIIKLSELAEIYNKSAMDDKELRNSGLSVTIFNHKEERKRSNSISSASSPTSCPMSSPTNNNPPSPLKISFANYKGNQSEKKQEQQQKKAQKKYTQQLAAKQDKRQPAFF